DILRFFQKNDAEPITAACNRGPSHGPRSVRTVALSHDGRGGMRVAARHAWFDLGTCKGTLLRAYDTQATAIANGLLFVYRTSCARGARGERGVARPLMPGLREASSPGADGRREGGRGMIAPARVSLERDVVSFEGRYAGDAGRI